MYDPLSIENRYQQNPQQAMLDPRRMLWAGTLMDIGSFMMNPFNNQMSGMGPRMMMQAQAYNEQQQQAAQRATAENEQARLPQIKVVDGRAVDLNPQSETYGQEVYAAPPEPQLPFSGTGIEAQMLNRHVMSLPEEEREAAIQNLVQQRLQREQSIVTPEGTRIVPGYNLGIEPTEPDLIVKGAGEAGDELVRVDAAINNYMDQIDQYGTEILPGKKKATLKAAHTNLMLELKELYNLGVLNGPDLELMQSVVPDPTALENQFYSKDALMAPIEQTIKPKLESARARYRERYKRDAPTAAPVITAPPPPPGFTEIIED